MLDIGQLPGCDNYMPYSDLMPDSDYNFSNAASPPSPDICISWRDRFSFQNNDLQAIPKTGGAITKLYAIPTNPRTDPIYYTIVSTCPAGCPWTDYSNFNLFDGVLISYNSMPLAPNVGDSQAFISRWPQTVVGYSGYCAKPNPISPDGPFIGYPLLSASRHTDLWALCTNTTANNRLDIVYSPIPNHPQYTASACQEVYIQMAP
ncbi:unnamed protein product [Cyclocybe aegerita]|uniref:Uncharacterized protein n=1 Tax=Cyclocybe aegerita TaxID=1973307 RepID=A0A8S0VWG4_CYCAE|nr:unnamed protein product [Cyclocybe aegerita]